MFRRILYVLICIIIGYAIGCLLHNELATVNGFIACMLVLIYLDTNKKDKA